MEVTAAQRAEAIRTKDLLPLATKHLPNSAPTLPLLHQPLLVATVAMEAAEAVVQVAQEVALVVDALLEDNLHKRGCTSFR